MVKIMCIQILLLYLKYTATVSSVLVPVPVSQTEKAIIMCVFINGAKLVNTLHVTNSILQFYCIGLSGLVLITTRCLT